MGLKYLRSRTGRTGRSRYGGTRGSRGGQATGGGRGDWEIAAGGKNLGDVATGAVQVSIAIAKKKKEMYEMFTASNVYPSLWPAQSAEIIKWTSI